MRMIEIGFLLVLMGMIFIIAGALTQTQSPDSKAKVAFGGFIGPIPFGFANDKVMLWVVVGLSIVLFALWVLFRFFR